MAAPANPSTPDSTTRRSFTAPIRATKFGASNSAKSTPDGSPAEGVEVLYTHPNAKVFKFQTSASSSISPGRPQSFSGTLPWATPAERTIAAGPLEIYHVRGSMTMLHSGALLHPLLPRSQCWCVDGVSKFVIRASIDTYYRIELPGETEEDHEKVAQLKATLQQRIFYERTACPFARTFSVDLPEEQPESRKKRRRDTEGKAKKWRLDHAYGWRPEGWEPGMDEPEEPDNEPGSASTSESEDSASSGEAEGSSPLPQTPAVGQSMRARAMQALRSASMPNQASPQRQTPSRRRTKDIVEIMDKEPTTAGAEREQELPALRTFQAIPTDMPPSPPDSSAGLDYSETSMPAEGWIQVEETVTIPHAEEKDEAVPTEEEPHGVETAYEENRVQAEAVMELLDGKADDVDDSIHSVIITEPPAVPVEAENDKDPHANVEHPADVPDAPVAAELLISAREDAGANASADEPAIVPDVPTTTELSSAAKEDICVPPADHIVFQNHQDLDEEEGSTPPPPPRRTNSDDPYAAIQARILARRSLSGTTSFHPLHKSPSRSSSSSHSSAATIISNSASRSHRAFSRHEDVATALVKRVYSIFLGPPAHLVALMLKIAARFASGAFGVDGMFHVETPLGSPRRPPGSYQLQTDGEHVEAVEIDSDNDEGWEDDEDDFGVKLHRSGSELTGLRERRGFEID